MRNLLITASFLAALVALSLGLTGADTLRSRALALFVGLPDACGVAIQADDIGVTVWPRPRLHLTEFRLRSAGAPPSASIGLQADRSESRKARTALRAELLEAEPSFADVLAAVLLRKPLNSLGLVSVHGAHVLVGKPEDRAALAALVRCGSDDGGSSGAAVAVERWHFTDAEVVRDWVPELTATSVNAFFRTNPSDGAVRFHATGSVLSAPGEAFVAGLIDWDAFKPGVHRVELEYSLDGLPLAALREAFPDRVHASFGDTVRLSGRAEGPWLDETTEEQPAEPFEGTVQGSLGWTVMGLSAPLRFRAAFGIDDRRIIVRSGALKWRDYETGAIGWFAPDWFGRFDLRFPFEGYQVRPIGKEFGFPPRWTPEATVDGEFHIYGKEGDPFIRYRGTTPQVALDSWADHPLVLNEVEMHGGFLEINAEAMSSLTVASGRVADLDFGATSIGARWYKRLLTIGGSVTAPWGDTVRVMSEWDPDEDDRLRFGLKVLDAELRDVLDFLAPQWGLGVRANLRTNTRWQFTESEPEMAAFGRTVLSDVKLAAPSPAAGLLGELGAVLGVDLWTPPVREAMLEPWKVSPRVMSGMELGAASGAVASAMKGAASGSDRGAREFVDDSTFIDRLAFEFHGPRERVEVAALEAEFGGLFIGGGLRMDAARHLTGEGDAQFHPAASKAIVEIAPLLESLLDRQGRLTFPVLIGGTLGAPELHLAQLSLDRLASAVAGEPVEPFRRGPLPKLDQDLPRIPGTGDL